MTARRMLSPDEVWIAAVDMAMHDRALYIESLSPEEVDAELRTVGLDPEELRAIGSALAAQYGPSPVAQAVAASDLVDQPSPESKRGRVISMVVPRGAGRAPVWLFAAALAAAAILGGIAYVRRSPGEARLPTTPAPDPSASAPTPPPSLPAAAPSPVAAEPDVPIEPFNNDLYQSAYDELLNPAAMIGAAQRACAKQAWNACRDLCDRAMSVDTRYRDSKSVAALRQLALQHVPAVPPPLPPQVRNTDFGKPVPSAKQPK